jgi:phosphatidylglycerophosphatase C
MSGPAGETTPSGVAAFDFDGTLTPADTFLGFLREVVGPARAGTALARCAPLLRQSRTDPAWRDVAKARLVRACLTGLSAKTLGDAGQAYANRILPKITPQMRKRLDDHHQAGHRTVLVSASLEVYLAPLRPSLGLDGVLATRLEMDTDGRATGALLGANCRGPEKARRLREWCSQHAVDLNQVCLWAYGDSAGDREMLTLAAFAVRVRRGRISSGSNSLTVAPSDPGGARSAP